METLAAIWAHEVMGFALVFGFGLAIGYTFGHWVGWGRGMREPRP